MNKYIFRKTVYTLVITVILFLGSFQFLEAEPLTILIAAISTILVVVLPIVSLVRFYMAENNLERIYDRQSNGMQPEKISSDELYEEGFQWEKIILGIVAFVASFFATKTILDLVGITITITEDTQFISLLYLLIGFIIYAVFIALLLISALKWKGSCSSYLISNFIFSLEAIDAVLPSGLQMQIENSSFDTQPYLKVSYVRKQNEPEKDPAVLGLYLKWVAEDIGKAFEKHVKNEQIQNSINKLKSEEDKILLNSIVDHARKI